MAHAAHRRTYPPNPAIEPPAENPGPHLIIDLSLLPASNISIPPPPIGSPSSVPTHNAYARSYGARGNRPTAESLSAKIAALKSGTSCPELLERAKLEFELAKLQDTQEEKEFYLVDADFHLRRALSLAEQYTLGEGVRQQWLDQITNTQNDLNTYAKEHHIVFSELNPSVQKPPAAPKPPEKTPARHATITRVAGGIIALLGIVFISGIVIHRFLVQRRIA
jgi:hypothetical protein